SEELESLSRKVQVQNFGPTLKQGGLFLDKTQEYGLSGLFAVSFNSVDLNLDGKSDLVILPTYYSRPKFYVFDNASKKYLPWMHDPLPFDFKASFLLFYDVNKDKTLDLIAGVLNQRSEVSQIPVKIYLGNVKNSLLSFTEDTTFPKLPPEPTSSITLLDYDLDGWVDMFIGNWFESKKGQYYPVPDRLLRNNKGVFEDATVLLKDEAKKASDQLYPPNARPTYGSSSCDVDQNGYPDIMTASSSGHKNKLWMNLGEQRTGDRIFEDLGPSTNYGSDPDGSLIPTGGGRNFFSACTDYNDDGIMDIFLGSLSHAYDNESVDKSSVLTGSRETYPPYFLRTEYLSDATSESWNQGDRRGVWTDYNLDGRIDLVVDNSGFPPYSRLVMFEQDESRAFSNVAGQLGIDIVNPTGTITMDVNHDGLPDLITSQNNIRHSDIPPRLYIFENQNKIPGRKAIKVHLRGIKSNTQALGAMVMLYTKQGTKKIVQRRWTEYTQGGLTSQNEDGVHFGLNSGVEAVGVKVRWPFRVKSGFKQGQMIEKLYPVQGFMTKDFVEVTVCEDGKILAGKMSCQF
ncbi:MAG: CRTAC1 family protein, partial [Bdellovibrionales bacterium]|nr:CRTAC1 family protein [Bdellovibrionales bacterium]